MEETSLIGEGITLTYFEKIVIGVLWFLIEVIGGLLLMGLIQYEQFGGDPLKRRLIDQVRKLFRGISTLIKKHQFSVIHNSIHGVIGSKCYSFDHSIPVIFL